MNIGIIGEGRVERLSFVCVEEPFMISKRRLRSSTYAWSGKNGVGITSAWCWMRRGLFRSFVVFVSDSQPADTTGDIVVSLSAESGMRRRHVVSADV